ncbi:MAG TPA: hypothetical protein VGB88_08240 [Alphaproteobacteria bacterium]
MRAVSTARSLAESDNEMIRVIEDLVTLLIDKKVIRSGELPVAALEKVIKRRLWRHRMNRRPAEPLE